MFVQLSDLLVLLALLFAEDTAQTVDFACRIFVRICNSTCIHPRRQGDVDGVEMVVRAGFVPDWFESAPLGRQTFNEYLHHLGVL